MATDSHQLETARQEVEYPTADGGLQSKISELRDEFLGNDAIEC